MYTKFKITSILIIILINCMLYSQENFKTVVISGLVGDYIDEKENIKYGLFFGGEDFRSVKILWSPENKYIVVFTFRDSLKTKSFKINTDMLTRYTEKIEFYDAIEDGVYKPGYSTISIDTTEDKLYVKLKDDYFTKLPFAKNIHPDKKFNPNIGFGGGVKFLKMDLGDMKRMYDYTEGTIRNNGFPINSNNLDGGPNKFLTANLFIKIYESFGIYFEAGKGLGSEEWKTYYTSGSLKYYFDINRLKWLKLHIGAGYTTLSFKTEQSYYARISSIIEGSYWRLDNINTEGYSKGYTLNLGTDIGVFDYSSNIHATLFIDFNYTFFHEKEYSISYNGPELNFNNTGKTNFNRFAISTGINFYF